MPSFERLPVLAMSVSLGASVALLALCWAPPVLAQGPRQEQPPRSGQASLPGPSDNLLAKLESIYKDIHANPELSMQERRTADIAANWLREQGYEVTEGWAARASSAFCATARAQRSCCGPTWTLSR